MLDVCPSRAAHAIHSPMHLYPDQKHCGSYQKSHTDSERSDVEEQPFLLCDRENIPRSLNE